MSNAFTPAQGIPERLVAGDFWTWRADGFAAAYPDPDYRLEYQIQPRQGGTATTIAATSDATGWRVDVAGAVTAALAPGDYTWALAAVRVSDTARATLCTGALDVAPDPTSGADGRSCARRLLAAIEATLEGRATKDVESYTIEGRALTRTPFEQLRATRARLLREVAAEDRAAQGRPGLITYTRARI